MRLVHLRTDGDQCHGELERAAPHIEGRDPDIRVTGPVGCERGGGSHARRGPLSSDEADKQIRSLGTLLPVNAAADFGYIAGGVLLIARGRRRRKTLRMSAGDGAAIAIQGAFLLVLNLSQARQLP